MADNSDVEIRSMTANDLTAELLYVKSLCDFKQLYQTVITPFFEIGNAEAFQRYLLSLPSCSSAKDLNDLIKRLLTGHIVICFNHSILVYEVQKIESAPVSEATVESIVQGPKDAFNDNIDITINLIRHRYQSPDLKVDSRFIGSKSRTRTVMLYDQSKVDNDVLGQLKDKLSRIETELLQSAGELVKSLTDARFNIFPTMIVTERPDRVVMNLCEGKIAVAVDGTPFVIILPSVFNDFFAAMDDKYQLPLTGVFLKAIRYIGLFLTFSLPAFYVAFTSYNPEILRVQLTLLIAGSRAGVPYPSFVEVLIMLIMMEFLVEASLRLPKAIGPTATTVGGLILGQAATEAGLVGSIMIILVSAVAISNFVIPVNMMNFSIRVIKYMFVLFATLFGLVGIVLGIVAFTMYLSNLRSFGKPYFKAFRIGNSSN